MFFGPKVRDAQFFDAFTAHAALSVKASGLIVELLTMLSTGAHPYGQESLSGKTLDPARALLSQINILESQGDKLTHDTVKRLHETWITPIDREDIRNLISRLDDVLDLTESVGERIVLFDLASARPEALELAKTLEKGCMAIHRAMGLLPKIKKPEEILAICVELHDLESHADKTYRSALADLFSPGHEPLMVMKWRDVLDSLETATDRAEDVGNIIEGIVLEYA